MKKRILFVCQQAPYGSSLAKEAFDAILAASVYEQDVAILFIGVGVYQLLPEQETTPIAMKSFNKMLAAFPLYGINELIVDAETLAKTPFKAEELCCEIKLATAKEIQKLMQKYDVIVPF
jgi:tRNA 2-thiouridine synthesizing protein C